MLQGFALISSGMNSTGANFKPVSISIVISESRIALDSAYNATCASLYRLFHSARLCGKDRCGFCAQFLEQIDGHSHIPKKLLALDDARRRFFPLAKPSSDNPIHFFSWVKEKFRSDVTLRFNSAVIIFHGLELVVSSRWSRLRVGWRKLHFAPARRACSRRVTNQRSQRDCPSWRRTGLHRASTVSLRRAHRRPSAQAALHYPARPSGPARTCFAQGQLTDWLDELECEVASEGTNTSPPGA